MITSTRLKLTFLLCWGHRVIIDTAFFFLKKIKCELRSDMQTMILLFMRYIPQHLFSKYQKTDPRVYVVSDRIYSFQSIFILDQDQEKSFKFFGALDS